MLNILVTGAAGFIGSHLAECLALKDYNTIGLDSFTDYYDIDQKRRNAIYLERVGVEMIEADLVADSLDRWVEAVDVIVHLAAQPGISASTPFDLYLRNNVVATHRLVESAVSCRKSPLFLYGSTSSVYGIDATGPESSETRPASYYGVTKLAAEQLVLAAARDRGLSACSCRLFSVYGPRERPDKLMSRLTRSLHDDIPFSLYEGSEDHERSYTYVGDIVKGLVQAIEMFDRVQGEILNLGSDISVRTADVIRSAESIAGHPLRIERSPRRPGDQNRTHADITKARQLIGYRPETSLRNGLTAQMAWYELQATQTASTSAAKYL